MVFESWKERVKELEEEVYTLYLASQDARTPVSAKALIVFVIGYTVSPIDLIPDFIPWIGYIDELILLPVGISLAHRLVPDEVIEECHDQAADELEGGNAQWIVAGISLLVWVVLLILVLYVFF